jgi:hypothetical protein
VSKKTLENLLPREKLSRKPSAAPSRYPSGTVWPHGEWSLGYASERPDGGEWHEDPFIGLGVDDVAMASRGDGPAIPLDLSDASNSHNTPKRGQNGITGYGQQMIKAAGFLMGERWPQHRKTLGTVTLPPMTAQARREVVEAWPELTRELLQWLSRRLTRQSLPPIVCSVSEVQPKRLVENSEAYLHWHVLWLNLPGKSGNWAIDPCDVRAWLESLLIRKIPSYQGGYINVDVKRVKGEAARYLAKYMSKGKQQVQEAMDDWGSDLCPRTWWNMTKPTRDMVKASTSRGRIPGRLLEATLDHAWATDLDSHYEFLRHIELEFEGVLITVGWRGRFTDGLSLEIRRLLALAGCCAIIR